MKLMFITISFQCSLSAENVTLACQSNGLTMDTMAKCFEQV